ncbi:MAG: hypothetical protein WC661_20175 [Opitutaceae bacterium]|jgi:hypothetical protein
MAALTQSEVDTVMRECPPHMDQVRQTGRLQLVAAGEQLGWRTEIRPIHFFESYGEKSP